MEGLPDDIAHFDMNTFPREDPRHVEARLKASEAEARAVAEEQRRQQSAVKKMHAMMAGKDEAEEDTAEEKPKRGRPPKAAAAPAKQTAASGPPPKTKKQIDADAARLKLKQQKIKLYFEKLGKKLTTKPPAKMPTDEAQLDAILAEIQAELQSAGGIATASTLFLSGCKFVQDTSLVFNPFGWALNGPRVGFAQAVAANKKEWDDLVTEFAIEHAEWFMSGPARRLMILTYQFINAVDSANKAGVATANPADASENLQEESKNL